MLRCESSLEFVLHIYLCKYIIISQQQYVIIFTINLSKRINKVFNMSNLKTSKFKNKPHLETQCKILTYMLYPALGVRTLYSSSITFFLNTEQV